MRIVRLLCILAILVFAIMMLWRPMTVVDGIKPMAQRLSGIAAGVSSVPRPPEPGRSLAEDEEQTSPAGEGLGLDAPDLPPASGAESSEEGEIGGDAAGAGFAGGASDGDQPRGGAAPGRVDPAGPASQRVVPASLRAAGFQPAFATFPELEQFEDVTPAILASKFEQGTGVSEGTALGLVGGVEDEIVNVPWMVGIRKRRQESDGAALSTSICGGAVFARRWVITAAHCLDDDYNVLEIIAGASDLDSENVIRRVSRRAFIHAGYERSLLRDDVAVIALDQAMPPFIPDAPFPTAAQLEQIPDIERVIGRGFGVTENGFDRNFLKKVELEVLEEGTGYRVIRVADPEGDIEGLCEGDSGSPVEGIVEGSDNFIIGMVSFNEVNPSGALRCTTPSFPAGVVSLEGYMDDIRSLVDLCTFSPQTCFGDDE